MSDASILRRSRPAAQRGFTLLELIVAAGILALIAVFSWRGLDSLIRERDGIAASQAAIDVLQRSFARIERDALLAGDVQLDEDGAMRLAAGTSSGADAAAPTVEYRLLDGALTRSVLGFDRAPQVMMDGVAALTMEAWTPGPAGGGGWVRVKGAATEVVRPPAAPGTNPGGTSAAGTPAQVGTPPGAQASGTGATPSPAASAVQALAPRVVAATGVRLSIVRVDGAKVVRAFLIGGG